MKYKYHFLRCNCYNQTLRYYTNHQNYDLHQNMDLNNQHY
nr:MAG TPA: hypothetical protein [Crassvirales sp.]